MSFKGITVTTSEESLGNITAADDAAIFQSLIGSDGVLNIGSNFATTVISNNKVRVADGVLCVGGHMGRTAYGDYNDMTIENGVSGKKRNDIIYAKFLTSGSTDTFTLDVKKGTSTTGTATDPALTQGVLYENATLREFPLWRVKLEGLSIVAVEQMFTVVPTIPELEAKYNELNSNLATYDYFEGTFATSFVKIVGKIDLSEYKNLLLTLNNSSGCCLATTEMPISILKTIYNSQSKIVRAACPGSPDYYVADIYYDESSKSIYGRVSSGFNLQIYLQK